MLRGEVRVRLAEGWREASRIEGRLSAAEGEIEEIRAFTGVTLEFRKAASEAGTVPDLLSGKAERLVYRPTDQTVWLFGDDAPATMRRVGEAQGTTSGQVLRYRLDVGTLEVDSGEAGPATIRTGN